LYYAASPKPQPMSIIDHWTDDAWQRANPGGCSVFRTPGPPHDRARDAERPARLTPFGYFLVWIVTVEPVAGTYIPLATPA
jgi:hypothetical protein